MGTWRGPGRRLSLVDPLSGARAGADGLRVQQARRPRAGGGAGFQAGLPEAARPLAERQDPRERRHRHRGLGGGRGADARFQRALVWHVVHLKSLTLKGFKSFAAPTTLRFEPGITCVVGPNGSGKSNVVDALTWVMGEHSAKTLRGGKMEDVIFAGTSSRAPLGRAEVTLTIDNSDNALPIEYSEVTISRLMFRSGQSEYAINGDTSRLLDIQA